MNRDSVTSFSIVYVSYFLFLPCFASAVSDKSGQKAGDVPKVTECVLLDSAHVSQ